MDIQQIILSAVSLVLGISTVMPYITKLQNLLKECADLLIVIKDAPNDGISKDDIVAIKKEAIEVWEAIKQFKK